LDGIVGPKPVLRCHDHRIVEQSWGSAR
jgi:hypothetical protein